MADNVLIFMRVIMIVNNATYSPPLPLFLNLIFITQVDCCSCFHMRQSSCSSKLKSNFYVVFSMSHPLSHHLSNSVLFI